MTKRIALATLGSLGDLHPFLGIAHELRSRGYHVTVASSRCHKAYVEKGGFPFHEVSPDLDPGDLGLIDAVLDTRHGPKRLHVDFIFPALEKSVNDFLPLAKEVDLIISGVIAYFSPICAELAQKPWVSALLSPVSFWSAYDPPILAPLPFLGKLRFLGPGVHRFALKTLLKLSEPWAQPVKDLRKRLGLKGGGNPFADGLYSKELVLALFSKEFAQQQPDWPPQAAITGFIHFDGIAQDTTLSFDLEEFLQLGEAPVIFTLGSTTVRDPGTLFDTFIAAAQTIRRRSVILVGEELLRTYKAHQTSDLFMGGYVPYSRLMSRGICIVHQGGVGTTAHAMLSGNPTLVLPSCNDQFDNAERVKRLGMAKVLPQHRVTVSRLANSIRELLTNPRYAQQSKAVRSRMLSENGPATAVDAIEETLGWKKRRQCAEALHGGDDRRAN